MSNTHLARGHVMHQFCGFCQLNKVPLLCFLKVKSLYCALHSSSQTDVKCWFFFCNLIYHVKPHPWWWQLAPGSLPVAQWYISPALFNLSITWNSVICLFCLSVPHSEAQCRKTFSPARHTKHTDWLWAKHKVDPSRPTIHRTDECDYGPQQKRTEIWLVYSPPPL